MSLQCWILGYNNVMKNTVTKDNLSDLASEVSNDTSNSPTPTESNAPANTPSDGGQAPSAPAGSSDNGGQDAGNGQVIGSDGEPITLSF